MVKNTHGDSFRVHGNSCTSSPAQKLVRTDTSKCININGKYAFRDRNRRFSSGDIDDRNVKSFADKYRVKKEDCFLGRN